jgi:hypothetical protein
MARNRRSKLFRIVGNASRVMAQGNPDPKIIEAAKKEGRRV